MVWDKEVPTYDAVLVAQYFPTLRVKGGSERRGEYAVESGRL